ncbi:hypothetical protein PLESTM_001238800 [Pleodorina starrii]|nr:hypothetical protein PLESTM_001238800 [Pleodorina starrii]
MIDRLVALLETPCFTFLRLQLLEPRKHPSLLRALYGLLMLLPQCNAFRMLNARLQAVPTLELLQLGGGLGPTANGRASAANDGVTSSTQRPEPDAAPPDWADLSALLRVFRAAQLRQYEAYVEQRRPPPLMPVGTAGPGVTFATSITDRPTALSTADKGGVPYLPGAGAAPSSGLGFPDVIGRPAGGAVSPPPAAAVSAAAIGVAQVLSFADEGTEPVTRGASGVLSGGGPSFGDGSALLAAVPADAQLAQQMVPQQLQNQTQQQFQGGGPAFNPEAVRGQLHVSSVGSN